MKKKLCKWTLMGLMGLVTLVALFYAEENWRGARAWEQRKAELQASGVPLVIGDILPPPVPDELNVAAEPIWRELAAYDEGRRDGTLLGDSPEPSLYRLKRLLLPEDKDAVKQPLLNRGLAFQVSRAELERIEKFRNENKQLFSDIETSLSRPELRWDLAYDKPLFEIGVPHVNSHLEIAKSYQLLGSVDLIKNDTESAFQNWRVIWSLNRPGSNNLLIGFLVCVTTDQLDFNLLWEGLHLQKWNEVQLLAFQTELQQRSYRDDLKNAFDWERVSILDFMSRARDKGMFSLLASMSDGSEYKPSWEEFLFLHSFALRPEGWFAQDKVYFTGLFDRMIYRPLDELDGIGVLRRGQEQEERFVREAGLLQRWITPISMLTTPAVSGCVGKYLQVESYRRMAVTACALERFRLKNGFLPDHLEQLIPAYLDSVPLDEMDHQPLRYVRKGERDYILYSIASDGQDDAGRATTKTSEPGDWVWPSRPGILEMMEPAK